MNHLSINCSVHTCMPSIHSNSIHSVDKPRLVESCCISLVAILTTQHEHQVYKKTEA